MNYVYAKTVQKFEEYFALQTIFGLISTPSVLYSLHSTPTAINTYKALRKKVFFCLDQRNTSEEHIRKRTNRSGTCIRVNRNVKKWMHAPCHCFTVLFLRVFVLKSQVGTKSSSLVNKNGNFFGDDAKWQCIF